MPKFPEPPAPAELARIGAAIHVLPPGTRIWRVHFQAGPHPTTWNQFRAFGPCQAGFDHHLPPPSMQLRQILYGAIGPKAAVTTIAEVFQAGRVVDRALSVPTWVAFDTTRAIPLLDLTSSWPTRAGASMALSSGPRPRSQHWSQAIHAAFPDIEGLLYGSSMNGNQPCVALYERALTAMPLRPSFNRMFSDPAILTLLKNACAEVGYLLT